MTSHNQGQDPRTVLGVQALAALGTPVRLALLSHLLDVGPRTASQCAPVVGASASNCSWHLRTLAAAGLVERVEAPPEGGDARQRPWRATSTGFDLSGAKDTTALVAARAVDAALSDQEENLLARHRAQWADLPQHWREVSGLHHTSLMLTAAELQELLAAVEDLLAPYRRGTQREAPEGAMLTSWSLRAFPHPDR